MTPPCEVFAPEAVARAEVAVIIPARNEVERIGPCLDSLASQAGRDSCAIHVCVNNTTDGTADIVRARAQQHGLALVLTELDLPRDGVGRARRLGHLMAMRLSPQAHALLSTDADCVAMPGWLDGMRRALRSHPAVLGRIEGLDDLPAALIEVLRSRGQLEDTYLRLSMEFARLVSDESPDAIGLNTAGGANLGVQRGVYRAVGGFRAQRSGEDRDLINRVIGAGHRPVRAEDAIMRASMRPDGRAPGGMADKIAARLEETGCTLDTALVGVSAMLTRSTICEAQRPALTSVDAARELPILRAHVDALKGLRSLAERRNYLTRVSQQACSDTAARDAATASRRQRPAPEGRLLCQTPDGAHQPARGHSETL